MSPRNTTFRPAAADSDSATYLRAGSKAPPGHDWRLLSWNQLYVIRFVANYSSGKRQLRYSATREHFIISVASVAANASYTLQPDSFYLNRCYWAYPRNPSLLGCVIFYLVQIQRDHNESCSVFSAVHNFACFFRMCGHRFP